MKFLRINIVLALFAFLLARCVEPYDPPVSDRDVNFLVVDGFLNISQSEAIVRLTRTLPVESTAPAPVVSDAEVWIEDDKGNFYSIASAGGGVYTGPVYEANTGTRYRLTVTTADQRKYESDFITALESPPIDSIGYAVTQDGVQFLVNTHDPSNQAQYFRWQCEETYQYYSTYNSVYMFEGDVIVYRPYQLSVHTCWRTDPLSDILVGSTKQLKESVIRNFPVSFIPKGSMKLSVEYSLRVRQQALTQEAYEYWSKLEKSTEHLGGLFDPLPSEVMGNIRGVTDPSETVIGFFSGGTVQEMRRFLQRRELPKEEI
ncbi:MAG TPA: DUF4249 domain-containing protein, partial [Chryseosolibacter sp.]